MMCKYSPIILKIILNFEMCLMLLFYSKHVSNLPVLRNNVGKCLSISLY